MEKLFLWKRASSKPLLSGKDVDAELPVRHYLKQVRNYGKAPAPRSGAGAKLRGNFSGHMM